MIHTADQLTALRAETVKTLIDYYDHPVTTPPDVDGLEAHGFGKRRSQQGRDAQTMVTRALKAGISMRQIAADAHLPGTLVINLIEDPERRAEAFVAELHHLDRSRAQVRAAQRRDARDRFAAGEAKSSLAKSFGVTRVTLDAWLAAAD